MTASKASLCVRDGLSGWTSLRASVSLQFELLNELRDGSTYVFLTRDLSSDRWLLQVSAYNIGWQITAPFEDISVLRGRVWDTCAHSRRYHLHRCKVQTASQGAP
ncbi:hypothetical protein C8Q76DRAFT_489198 [Earliella scabrosa]|nr:hypothetical protein C8Q76DRAFT_489198 [Earliella scabrosa]